MIPARGRRRVRLVANSSRVYLFAAFCLLSLLTVVFNSPSASSKNPVSTNSHPEQQAPVRANGAGSATEPAEAVQRRAGAVLPAELLQRAQDEGQVRVIVGLRASFQPEGLLTRAAAQTQRAAIARAQTSLLSRLAGVRFGNVKRFALMPYLALEIDAAGLARLAELPDVVSLQEDQLRRPSLAESVPLIGAPAAWASGFSGTGQAVAILDTGVDKTHPFLAGKVVSEACYSTTSAVSSSVCPGGVAQSTATNSGGPCSLGDCAHGTHVAGIAAGSGTSFSGVARDANLIAIQVFSRGNTANVCGDTPAPCVLAFDSDVLLGLQRVQALSSNLKIAAVNMSLGGGSFSANCDISQAVYKTAIDNLRSVGIATVIASGNEGGTATLSAPACISTAISVGSSRDGSNNTVVNTVSSFSNSASFLHLLAPGEWINSSVPGGSFASFRGTSMAAPHVAGAWAVMKSKSPNASVSQVLQSLMATGVALTDARNGLVKPRIKLDAAVNALSADACNYAISPPALSFGINGGNGTVNVTTTAGCAWTVSSNAPWIIASAGGTGNGTVTLTVAPNSGLERSGTVFIAGQTLIVTQTGAPTLAVDDGSFELFSGLGSGGTSFRVNRLTPTSYPAVINGVAIFLPGGSGLRVGDAVTIVAGTNPSGSGNLNGISYPISIAATVQALDQFNVFSIPPLATNAGDFVVGMRITHAAGVFPVAIDTDPPLRRRSYRSLDGVAYSLIDDIGTPGNYSMRGLISVFPENCAVPAALNPSSGIVGSTITITGANLTGVTAVKFNNNLSAQFTVVSNTQINATVPAGALTGAITLSKAACPDIQTPVFTVSAPPGCSYTIAPASQTFAGAGGTGTVNVTASAANCPWTAASNDTWITVTSGAAGTGDGTVTYSVAASTGTARTGTMLIAGRTFTVSQGNNCPTVTALNPTSATTGANVILTGAGFTGVTAVRFSNNAASTFTVNSDTQITAVIPASAVTGVLTLSKPGCPDVQTPVFTVALPSAPVISNLNPSFALVGGASFTLTVNGANFVAGSKVRWNNADRFTTFVSASRLTATILPSDLEAEGTVIIKVVNPAPGGASNEMPFTISQQTPVPVLTSISPTSATVGGVAFTLTVNGNNFASGAVVQWNGSNRPTNVTSSAQLTAAITAADIANVGTANVTVNNPAPGGGASSAAVFTIQPNPRLVRVVAASGATGGTVNVPIELAAQGNENSLAFSLVFDPTVLSNPVAALGSDAANAALTSNSTQNAQGRLGVVLGLPAGQSFSAGTRQVAVVTFTIAAATTAQTTPLGFGDQPTARELASSGATPLPADFVAGQVSITPGGIEADVAPRPNGNNNGVVSLTDYVQVGRFVAGVDTPAVGSEFQRADCAPLPTLGDGRLTVTDWAQAGRYASGLDAPRAAGGPTAPLTSQRKPTVAPGQQPHLIRAVPEPLSAALWRDVAIVLDAQGSEHALGFTLTFDPTHWQLVSVAAESDDTRLIVNKRAAANGQLGVVLGRSPGQRFRAGAQRLLRVRFQAMSNVSRAPLALSFTDDVVNCELVDVEARPLAARFLSEEYVAFGLGPLANRNADQIAGDAVTRHLEFVRAAANAQR